MIKRNPRCWQAPRAGMSIAADKISPTTNREILKSNAEMRARLNLLLWGWRLTR